MKVKADIVTLLYLNELEVLQIEVTNYEISLSFQVVNRILPFLWLLSGLIL
jgi:hypothetical protein